MRGSWGREHTLCAEWRWRSVCVGVWVVGVVWCGCAACLHMWSPAARACCGVGMHVCVVDVVRVCRMPQVSFSMHACKQHTIMCACVRACMRVCMCACMHVCMCACMRACVHVCVHACVCACVHASMRARVCASMRVSTCVRMCVHARALCARVRMGHSKRPQPQSSLLLVAMRGVMLPGALLLVV